MTGTHDFPGHSPDPGLLFGERVLRIIDEGRRVATYKLALLLALLDALASKSTDTGAAPATLHTRVIASHVLGLYLPQASPFTVGGDTHELRQISAKSSRMFRSVAALRHAGQEVGCTSPTELEAILPERYEATLDEVERTFARYPIRLLQVVGGENVPFLYDIDWDQRVGLRQLHASGGGLVSFRPGAGDALLRLGPLIRPLVETHWARMVATLSGFNLDEERLRAHLFGTTRRAFPRTLRAGLAEICDGRCFYCGDKLPRSWAVDHFIPWSRHPNDAIENLIATDARCNGAKSDSLPALVHVERWGALTSGNSGALAELAGATHWPSDRPHTVALVRSTYRHLPTGTPLWVAPGVNESFTDHELKLF